MPWGLVGGLIGGLGSIVGAGITAGATKSAANTEAQAAQIAAQLQAQEFNQVRDSLAPFLGAGTNALNYLGPGGIYWPLLSTSPTDIAGPNPQLAYAANQPQWNFNPLTLSTFQQSPGYQYQLNEATRAAQNASAGNTGALSGNMLRGIQRNAYGLANQDWWNAQNFNQQNYLNQYNALNQAYTQTQGYIGNAYNQRLQGVAGQQSNIYNMLAALAGSGQNAAANLGAFGQAAVGAQGNYLTQGANAQAAGQIGLANALNRGITGVTTNLLSPTQNYSNSNLANALAYFAGNQNTGGGDYPQYNPYGPGASSSANYALGYP